MVNLSNPIICRPVSILPVISKIYERLMYDQMYKYFDEIYSKFQCSFHKRFSTQNCLKHDRNLETIFRSRGHCWATLTYFSKAFDCIRHELLIVKLQAYEFDNNSKLYL